MKMTFNDSQTLNVQSMAVENGIMRVSIINNMYEQLKALFTDTIATQKITVENGSANVIYERYSIFYSLTEKPGKIFEVIMEQEGKDTNTRLQDVENNTKDNILEITETQLALCEIYELLEGVMS